MADNCIMCGKVIPEGRQVCPNCELKIMQKCKSCIYENTKTCLKCSYWAIGGYCTNGKNK